MVHYFRPGPIELWSKVVHIIRNRVPLGRHTWNLDFSGGQLVNVTAATASDGWVMSFLDWSKRGRMSVAESCYLRIASVPRCSQAVFSKKVYLCAHPLILSQLALKPACWRARHLKSGVRKNPVLPCCENKLNRYGDATMALFPLSKHGDDKYLLQMLRFPFEVPSRCICYCC